MSKLTRYEPTVSGRLGTMMSRHAQRRAQERSIPQVIIDALLDFGQAHEAPGGAWRHVFGKKGWARFCRHMGPNSRHYEKYRRAYLIVSGDDVIITAIWQH